MLDNPANISSPPVQTGHIPENRRVLLAATLTPEIGTTARFLYLWLEELVGQRWGKYPGPTATARFLECSRQSVWRAEAELAKAGLAEFDNADPENPRVRCLKVREMPEKHVVELDLFLNHGKDRKPTAAKAEPPAPKPKRIRKRPTKKPEKTQENQGENEQKQSMGDAPPQPPQDAPAPPVEAQGATAAAAPADQPTQQRAVLSQDQGEWIRSSLENMTNYLLFGANAAMAGKLDTPTRMNWRQHITVVDNQQQLNLERWTTEAFMGFYWYRVSKYRSERQIPLTLPVGFGRTGKTLKALQKAIGPMALFNLINDLTNHFDVVRYLFGGRYGTTLTLDETTLDRAEVRGVVQQIQAYGQEALAAIYQQMIEAQAAASGEDE